MRVTIQKRSKSKQQGITLIVLVVTIVILLILAGVTINLLFSDTGLLRKAQEARNTWENTEQSDINAIGELTNELMEILGENPRATDIYVFLYDDGTLTFGTQNEPIEGENVVKEYGNIKGKEYSSWVSEDNNRMSNTPWFNDASLITKVKIVDIIVPTSMSSWFDSCINLTELENIDKIDTSEVESMNWIFDTCSSLTSLNLSSFNTSNVENMNWMFQRCSSLTDLDINSFNTSNVRTMQAMFAYCTNLTTIYVGDNWDLSNVEDTNYMFEGCGTNTTIPKGSN